MKGDPIRRLAAELGKLPGIGEKSATRLAFHLLRCNKQQVRDLAAALLDVTEKVRLCSTCFAVTEQDPCALCEDARREPDTLCVVATPSDLIAIERGGQFRGRFHVLHGVLSPLEGIGPEDLRIAELVRRVGTSEIKEVILATAPSVEGEATAMYIAKLLKPQGVRISRIATGLPVGADFEYADQATINRAFAHRAPL